MTVVVAVGALLLAFVNGANDNMKGVATLCGSGALSYRRALALASGATALGGLASLALSTQLAHAFSAKGLIPDAFLSDGVLAAVALAAAGAVLVATYLGLPVSTTHALLGALFGAGVVAAGSALDLQVLGASFALPLALSPLIAVVAALAIVRAGRRLAGSSTGVEKATRDEVATATAAPAQGPVVPRSEGGVPGSPRVSAGQAITRAHVSSAGVVCFARGLNDTPKILGLVVGASAMGATTGALAITAAMVLGGVVAARRVTQTIAHEITPMSPATGLAGNLATASLVLGASRLGLPVSTTHVSVGSIFGIGADSTSLQGPTVRRIAAAWVGTLPVAALFGGALAMWFG